jgi:hypothetical protein
MKTLLGIDFGTTTTVVAQTTPESRFGPELIEVDGLKRIETVIRLDPEGRNVERIGEEAWDELFRYPERTFFDFKPYIESDKSWFINGKPITAFDLSVLFLRAVREKIEAQHFCRTSLADMEVTSIIGYPAEWEDTRKTAVVEIAKQAGFTNVLGCDEPLGAVYYHHFKEEISIDHPQLMLVYDFGGGTTDVSIMRCGPDRTLELLGGGGMDVGGHHFDNLLTETFSERISQEVNGPLSDEDQARVRTASQRLKERLSNNRGYSNTESEILIPVLKAKGSSYRLTLDFQKFELLGVDLIGRFEAPIHSALKRAGIEKSEIDAVILAGGAGRLYYAREKLRELFPPPQKYIQTANPQEVIAMGLALYGREKLAKGSSLQVRTEGTNDEALPAPSPNHEKQFNSIRRIPIKWIISSLFVLLLPIIAWLFWPPACPDAIPDLRQKLTDLKGVISYSRARALLEEVNALNAEHPSCIQEIADLKKGVGAEMKRIETYCTHTVDRLEKRYDKADGWINPDLRAMKEIRAQANLLSKQCPPVLFQRIKDIERKCDKKLD